MQNKEGVYGECAKHKGQNMVDCSECEMEKAIHDIIIPKRKKSKISPYNPIMQINEANAAWIKHCVNKKSKTPKDLILDIEIRYEKVKVILIKINAGTPIILAKAESKYDINEAIRLVIDQYAVTNFNNFLRGK